MAAPDWPGALKIVRQLRQHKNAWPFNEPVDPVALNIPDYFQVVTHPMDLGTVENRIQSNYYKTLEDLTGDVRQVWDNAAKYNGPEHDVTKMAQSLSDIFEQRLKALKEKSVAVAAGGGASSAASAAAPKKKSSTPGKIKTRVGGQDLSYEEKRELCFFWDEFHLLRRVLIAPSNQEDCRFQTKS